MKTMNEWEKVSQWEKGGRIDRNKVKEWWWWWHQKTVEVPFFSTSDEGVGADRSVCTSGSTGSKVPTKLVLSLHSSVDSSERPAPLLHEHQSGTKTKQKRKEVFEMDWDKLNWSALTKWTAMFFMIMLSPTALSFSLCKGALKNLRAIWFMLVMLCCWSDGACSGCCLVPVLGASKMAMTQTAATAAALGSLKTNLIAAVAAILQQVESFWTFYNGEGNWWQRRGWREDLC